MPLIRQDASMGGDQYVTEDEAARMDDWELCGWETYSLNVDGTETVRRCREWSGDARHCPKHAARLAREDAEARALDPDLVETQTLPAFDGALT